VNQNTKTRKRKYSDATKAKRNERSRAARKARVDAGLCAMCGNNPPVDGLTRCQVCRDYAMAHNKKRADAGLCAYCKKRPVEPGQCRCSFCLAHAKRKREQRRAVGLCIHCGCNPATEQQPSCADCRAAQLIKMRQRRLEVLTHYGLFCACCGEDTFEFLQIDHINNDGARHRREVGRSLYSWLQKNGYPAGFQTLCANCNIAKAQHGVCPHQRQAKND